MPMYEYRCTSCNHTFETLVLSGEPALACPACQGQHLEKLLSLPSAGTTSEPSWSRGCDADLPPCHPRCCRLPQPGLN